MSSSPYIYDQRGVTIHLGESRFGWIRMSPDTKLRGNIREILENVAA